MIKKSIIVNQTDDAVIEAAEKATDELYDFIEQHQETIDRYNELTAKFKTLSTLAYRARERQTKKMTAAK